MGKAASTRIKWIDTAKFIAIIAVLTDHLSMPLQFSRQIQTSSYFSVSLFILLTGFTTFLSFSNTTSQLTNAVKKRIINILLPYTLATFIIHCFIHCGFDLAIFVQQWYLFNTSSPHYFVLLYVLLMLISPILFNLIKYIRNRIPNISQPIAHIVALLIIIFISRFTNAHTNIANIYGIRLLGGSYLICLYLGMLFAAYYDEFLVLIQNRKSSCILFFLSSFTLYFMITKLFHEEYIFDSCNPLCSNVNPPGLTIITTSIVIMFEICLIDSFCEHINNRALNVIRVPFSYVGKHTLYIFLYHMFLFEFFLVKTIPDTLPKPIVPIYYVILIVVPILIQIICNYLGKLVSRCYS